MVQSRNGNVIEVGRVRSTRVGTGVDFKLSTVYDSALPLGLNPQGPMNKIQAELEVLRREAEEEVCAQDVQVAEEVQKVEEDKRKAEKKVEKAKKKKTERVHKVTKASRKRKAVMAENALEVGNTIEEPQPGGGRSWAGAAAGQEPQLGGKPPLVFYIPKWALSVSFVRLQTSLCIHCQKRKVKDIVDADIQFHHNKKQEEPTSSAWKWVKRSTVTIEGSDEELMQTPSMVEGKGKEVAGLLSAKTVEKVAEDVEDRAEKGGMTSKSPFPGQKTRRAIIQLYRFLNEEVELHKELITQDLKVIKGTITKAVNTTLKWWIDSEVHRIVRKKVEKAFTEHLTEEDNSEGSSKKNKAGNEQDEKEDEQDEVE
ncbi:hypothetical protein BV20DRAFT_979183 [Pilatotrama ljubarskyi]|nr:hypothetical protein BV20DRAFT_979183 [Pilatotrama ljubarskyi]